MARKNSTPTYLVAALLFLGGVGYLVWQGLSENSAYFLDVAEAKAKDASSLSNIRLFGTVAREGVVPPESGAGVAFTLEDQHDPAQTLRVDYRGAVPDAFKEGAEVIVEGDMKRDGSFSAKVLMTKCPSKYQKENRKG